MMTSTAPTDWHSAFLEQARSDFEAAGVLAADGTLPRCHLLHYLQMTLEKLSKGMHCEVGDPDPPEKTHAGARRLVQFVERAGAYTRGFHEALGMSPNQRRRYLRDSILPLADKIERLVPALAGDGPNLEYPWAVPNANPATFRSPSRYNFPITESEIERIMKFLRTLLATCS